MRTAVIVVAAGRGTRLGAPVPKQYLPLGGRVILSRTLDAVLGSAADAVIVAIRPQDRASYDAAAPADPRLLPPVEGGAERADSVRRALEALEPHAPQAVLIHDAARPFAPPALFDRLADLALSGTAAIAAEPVVDALWRADAQGGADTPVPRAGLWRAQTPQAFPFAPLLAAHRLPSDTPALDDAQVFRNAGHAVSLVDGPPENFKITTADDLARAGRMVAQTEGRPMDVRTGHGFDVHRFVEGDHVWLCGVKIAHSHSLSGHSDADVGLHALADALYGAIADGDIGRHFPPSDPQWKGAESHIFLSHAAERVRARGGRIGNLDVTLLCEAPKIGPHAATMQARVAEIAGIAPDRVSIKATTMERMGFIGREEGMGCIANATVILPDAQPEPEAT